MRQRQGSHGATARGDDLVIYVSRGKVMRMTLVGVALKLVVGTGALLGPSEMSGYRGSPVVRLLVLLFGLPAHVVVTVRTFLLLFSSAPRLVVSHEGICRSAAYKRKGACIWQHGIPLA